MKKITFTLFSLLFTFCLMAQAPIKMSYQAIVRDANGQLITNSTVGMRISILKDSPTGPVQYAETHTSTTNANGLVTLEIGEGTPVSGGTFFSVEWQSGSHYVQTETDPNGGTNYTISGTSQLLSVPYALYSNIAGVSTAWTLVGNHVASVPSGNVGIGTGGFIPQSKLQVEADDAIRIYGTQGSFDHGGTIHFGDGNIVYLKEYEDDNLKLRANKTWVDSDVWVGPDPFQLNTGVDASKFEVKGEQVAIRGQVSVPSDNSNSNSGVEGFVQGGLGFNTGVYGYAGNGAVTRGVLGFGSNAFTGATGVYGFGQGTLSRGVYGEANGTGSFAGFFNGNLSYTGNLSGPSDAKLKKEIMALDGALEKVLQLQPKTYYFKTDEFTDLNLPAGPQIGFIAQEVQDIFPGVVHETAHVALPKPGEETEQRTTEYISINYLGFIPVLTKAIQEQQEEIESLKKENETLEARLNRLEALVEDLQK